MCDHLSSHRDSFTCRVCRACLWPLKSLIRLSTMTECQVLFHSYSPISTTWHSRVCGAVQFNLTYVKLPFPTGWLIHGIVYLTGLFLLIPLTRLKLDWINFGTGKILYMILEHSCRGPEVVVKCCVRKFSNLVYRKVILLALIMKANTQINIMIVIWRIQ